MRTIELARVALAAETLYLRRVARRQALRGVFAVAAAIFGLALLASLHIVIFEVARLWLTAVWSAVVVLGVDLVVTAILGLLAARGLPDPVEAEARQLRVQALDELKRSLTAMGIAAEVAGLALRAGTRRTASGGVQRGLGAVAAEIASRLVGR